jgi:ClpP class serine protease
MMHVDQSGADAKRGVVYTPIYAGARKVDFNPHAPISDATRAIAQAEVDRIYELFVDAVAGNRKMKPEDVKATEAGIFPAQDAAALGLIDAVESFDTTLQAITAEARRYRIYGPRDTARSRTSIGDLPMSTANADSKPAATAGAVTVEQQVIEARDAGLREGQRVGAEAERVRIAGILTHAEAAERRGLAEHLAFKTANTIEDAAALMAASPKAAAAPANTLASRMAKEPQPQVGADVEITGAQNAPKINAANIYAMRRKANNGSAA